MHMALKLSFVLQGHLEDAQNAIPVDMVAVSRRKSVLEHIKKASIGSLKDNEMRQYIDRYKVHMIKNRSKVMEFQSERDLEDMQQFRNFMDKYMNEMGLKMILSEYDNALIEGELFDEFIGSVEVENIRTDEICKILDEHPLYPKDKLTMEHSMTFLSELMEELDYTKDRAKFFYDEISFVYGLTGISSFIKSLNLGKFKDQKKQWLKLCLEDFNNILSKHTYLPMETPTGERYRILNIVIDDATVLNSRDRVPYLVVFEAILGTDDEILEKEEQEEEVEKEKEIVEIDEQEGDGWVVLEPSNEEPPSYLDEIFGLSWEERKRRYRKKSKYGHYKNWDLVSLIVKGGDDLRQEQLTTGIIKKFYDIFKKAGTNIWVYPYEILALSSDGGFIQAIHDTVSVHVLKAAKNRISLREYFKEAYNDDKSMKEAQKNFALSLAGYSLICYILQIKDRHNGNILIDREGHIIHIDYGFILTTSPGSLGFEKAPFKLTMEYIEVMGGARETNDIYTQFIKSFQDGFLEVRKHYEDIVSTIEMMMPGSKMACFSKGENTVNELKSRFQLNLTDEEAKEYVVQMINQSKDHWRTLSYDKFQKFSNYIY